MATPLKCLAEGKGIFHENALPILDNSQLHLLVELGQPQPQVLLVIELRDVLEEREFLREMMTEKRQHEALKKEVEDKRRFKEHVRLETARHAKSTKAELMALLERQFMMCREEVRREEFRSPASCNPRRRAQNWDDELDNEDLDDEIRRLLSLRERGHKGKATATADGVRFRQPTFDNQDGSVDENRTRAETSRDGEERTRPKIPAGSGPEGLLQFVLDQRQELSTMKPEQLKRILH
ncbi:hypothetical protein CBR_g48034 [Chara braunii]|uniref:Uncharacterized protein n=1 Tax=Chara braunii TaxID=69332 RepID=A0A388M230_CHABU|nr:hypothetical protein CBR_g48034 [Chara braunii]|eukprot:GBG88565.1 hypothetical protein CBR_g48034 [Chara braunii]